MVRRGEATTCSLKLHASVAAVRATSNSIAGVLLYSARGDPRVRVNRVERGNLRVKVKGMEKGKVKRNRRGDVS